MSTQLSTQKNDIKSLLMKMKPQIALALPKHMTPERLLRIALSELSSTPALSECTSTSFLSSLMTCAQLGVEPGKALGHAYLIPFKGACTFILGYRGMIDIARRSGQILSICAHEVFENDEFDFTYGIDEKLIHKPALKNRGEVIGFYSIAKLNGGGYQFEWMSIEDVEAIKKRSKASSFGPWVTDFNEMAKKTVVRKLFKYLPISIEIQKAVTLDEAADRGEQNEFIDNIFDDSDSICIDANNEGSSLIAESHLKNASEELAKKISST